MGDLRVDTNDSPTEANAMFNNRPAWVDIASQDPAATRDFYSRLFGWDIQVSPDPQYGGYAMAMDAGVGVAGIGPKMDPNQPTAWQLYLGTVDADAVAQRVEAAGGTVVTKSFEVGDQGRMAVFRDPSGAFISVWQALQMRGFVSHQPGAFDWGELNARGVEKALPFYKHVFGWDVRTSTGDPAEPPYHEFQIDGESILGAWEMNPMVPAEVPAYWQIYFGVDDVDAAFATARALGATELVAPRDMTGGRFAIMRDPQGASFGLLHFEVPEI
jgi:predicted enzyme related to lactoylglutathione lyase